MRLLLQKMKKAKTLMPITEKKANMKFPLLFLGEISLFKSSLLQILMPDMEKKAKTLTIMDEKVETLMHIMEKKAKNLTPIMKKKVKVTLLFLSKYLYSSPSSLQITQETSLMITVGKTILINHQVNKDFSKRQDTNFRVMAMPSTVTMRMRMRMREIFAKGPVVDISLPKPAPKLLDTILNAGEKPLIVPKNSLDVSSCSTTSFQVGMPIFKMRLGFSQKL